MSSELAWEINDPEGQLWDVIVIGSGMGGSTAAYALAGKGHKVLVVEKGLLLHKSLPGADSPTAQSPAASDADRPGQWPHRLTFRSNVGDADIEGNLGCGSGGTTVFYGAVLERMAPMDFAPADCFPKQKESTLPARWPVSFDEMLPWYKDAERLFRVRGTPDPIYGRDDDSFMPPPELDPKDKALFDYLQSRGLQPYRLHLASEFYADCENCTGFCNRPCKNDAGKICLVPALNTGYAKFIGGCTVTRLEADSSTVKSVVCVRDNATLRIRGKVIVLAAGAYGSPLVLLNSTSAHWPRGLGNRSGLVGKNLMMHTTDFFAIWPKGMGNRQDFSRTVALRDFYYTDGAKLGMVQSSGVKGNWGLVLRFLRDYCDRSDSWWIRVARPALPVVAWFGAIVFNRSVIMATVTEDLPYTMNHIVADAGASGGFRVEYQYTEELRQRNALLRDKIRGRFGRRSVAFLLERKNNLNFGHPCGTCRFGDDPDSSVLNKNNRAHELDNLYVVDGSFFPSSAGVNPSLTIAANALRVAEVISGDLSVTGQTLSAGRQGDE